MAKLELLKGTYKDDPECLLSLLQSNGLIISNIFNKIDEMYKPYVHKTSNAYKSIRYHSGEHITLPFPKSQSIDINMMPFKLWDLNTLPQECQMYRLFIETCRRYTIHDKNHIAYLTIQESDVAAGNTQRRSGLHLESPVVPVDNAHVINRSAKEYTALAWGLGCWEDEIPVGGMFIASSVTNTTQIWDAIIQKHEDIADQHGGIECLRLYLGNGHKLQAGEICWMTDRTPHEALPISYDTHRQFFRLVIGKIDVWYSQHSTPNPLGVQLPETVRVDHSNKFSIQG